MTKSKYRREAWRQISGDMDPGSYGGIIARFDGDSVELIEIQPIREYCESALHEGHPYPFWSKEARYTPDDLELQGDVLCALDSWGISPDDLPTDRDDKMLVIAEACMRYGHWTEEGPSGWAKDILGDHRVYWWGSKGAQGWRYLADEDREVRQILREAGK